jgi:hypothetical protein
MKWTDSLGVRDGLAGEDAEEPELHIHIHDNRPAPTPAPVRRARTGDAAQAPEGSVTVAGGAVQPHAGGGPGTGEPDRIIANQGDRFEVDEAGPDRIRMKRLLSPEEDARRRVGDNRLNCASQVDEHSSVHIAGLAELQNRMNAFWARRPRRPGK